MQDTTHRPGVDVIATARAALEESLRGVLVTLQRLNGQRPFGVCRQCAHFLREPRIVRCGLTGEALASEQTLKICREWTAPASAA